MRDKNSKCKVEFRWARICFFEESTNSSFHNPGKEKHVADNNETFGNALDFDTKNKRWFPTKKI